jgi:hypothetical protein
MREPIEVFPGNLSSEAVDRDAVLMSGISYVRFEQDIVSDIRRPLTFLQVSTVLQGVCE